MTNCPDLCTAAKCQELESRIVTLENLVNELINRPDINYESLQDLLNEHINKKTSEAHEWDIKLNGQIKYDTSYDDISLELYFASENGIFAEAGYFHTDELPFVLDETFQLHLDTPIPTAHKYEPTIEIEVIHQNDGSDLLALTLEETRTETYINTEPLELSINQDNSNDVIEYDFEVKLGNKVASDKIEISSIQNEREITNLVEKYFNDINFYFRIDDLPNNDRNFYFQI